MKKSNFLLLSFIVLLLTYVGLMFVSINNFTLNKIWFSLSLMFIGIYALIYAFSYKLDSCTYYGILLICFAFITIYRYFSEIEFFNFYPLYIFCFSFAHLSVFVLFRQNIHFKLFAFLFLEVILLSSYKMQLINFWLMFAINVVLLGLFAINYLYRLRKNLRRHK